MATSIPSLSWACPRCGQQIPVGQIVCPNPTCSAGTGAPPQPPQPPRPPRPQPASQPPQPVAPAEEEDEGNRRRRLIAIIAAASVLILLGVLLMARGCGAKKTPTPPAPAVPASTVSAPPPPAVPDKPSPMTPAAPAATSSQELVKELRRIGSRLEEINRRIPAEQAGAAVNALGEIRGLLERQPAAVQSPPAQPQRLSDRELERRFKERLLSQEP